MTIDEFSLNTLATIGKGHRSPLIVEMNESNTQSGALGVKSITILYLLLGSSSGKFGRVVNDVPVATCSHGTVLHSN